MNFFSKKDKRYNNHLDNHMSKYEDLFKLGLVMTVIGLVYYELFKYLIY